MKLISLPPLTSTPFHVFTTTTNCRPVDCAAAYLRDSRADPATLCAAKHYTLLQCEVRLDHCLARLAGLHHPVTPVLPSRSVSDCCTGTHEAVVRDCSQHYPRRYQQYRRAKRPRSARVPVLEWCALPIERATSNGRAIQALSHAPTDQTLPQPIMGRRRGVASGQGAEPPN